MHKIIILIKIFAPMITAMKFILFHSYASVGSDIYTYQISD